MAAGYDELADRADSDDLDRTESPWGDSRFQRHYAWPALEAILPDVGDDRVLLAGCGRGDHVGWFLDRGARVVGVDVSERAVAAARDRFGTEATFRRADLTDALDFADGAFDLVVSNLALSHVESWPPVFASFRRLLAPDGTLAFATVHPHYLRQRTDANYYETAAFENPWPGADIPTYYRPMGEVVDAVVSSGLRIESFEEPRPTAAFREHCPDRYEDAMTDPQLLVVRAAVE
ncbi:class I SAM-dependent methyltransferase [Halorussus rarus]|uniref:class I SAM-dependent methyltransferase n=1 Tax=Halorussus TaxID=1070314 RepID=UPI000E213DB1|nr:class I SAM-dependent methyltransferase [Halorussus rarus]NHN59493.1 class I SAM-dependent methyltransferase [Halorussus sp. JP-T4]